MAKPKTVARCSACDRTEPRWVGRCPGCGAWGTMGEEAVLPTPSPSGTTLRKVTPTQQARPIAEVALDTQQRTRTQISEFDRVLGGGLVPGSVVLLGGEPGAGKSTLLLQAAAALSADPAGPSVLYVSAEESPGQVRLRAERLGTLSPRLLLAAEHDVNAIVALIDAHGPDVVIVDSIQTVRQPEIAGAAGGVAQVRECAGVLVSEAKRRGVAVFLVGHVTKDGQLAGPRVLEHLVDVVLEVEGDRHHALRLLRSIKNRYGAAGEVGCFEMTDDGMAPVSDAGRLFVGDAAAGTAGVAVTLALEGRRPLACEVQALVGPNPATSPRRVASGLDAQRIALLCAVLHQRTPFTVGDRDVFASTVGGVRLTEPAADLALCLAVASSRSNRAVPRDVVVLGEVGLAGEVRQVGSIERRLGEAARLGFAGAIVPAAYDGPAHGLRVMRARDLRAALDVGLA